MAGPALATYPSSSSDAVYTIRAAAAGPYCDCMGWKTSKASPKTCKHLRDFLSRRGQTLPPPTAQRVLAPSAPANTKPKLLVPNAMLAQPIEKAPRQPWGDPEWVADVKLDGERKLAVFRPHPIFYSRSKLAYKYDWANDLVLPEGTILDGELVEAGGHQPWGSGGRRNDEYQVFDVLQVGEVDLRHEPWTLRREALELVVKGLDHPRVKAVEVLGVPDQHLAEEYMERGFEGVMLKRRTSVYQGLRSWDWLKYKWTSTWDVVVVDMQGKLGVNPLNKNLRYGWYKGGKLQVAGDLGVLDLPEKLEPYIGKVVEVHGYGLSPTGAIRHPQMLRVRDDKLPQECVLD